MKNASRPGGLHRGSQSHQHRRELGSPECFPFGGEPIGIREEIHGSCSSSSRRNAARNPRAHVGAERCNREPAVIELIAGIADVVEVDAVDGISPGDVRDDGLIVRGRFGLERRDVEALDLVRIARGPSAPLSRRSRGSRIRRPQILRDLPRNHEPLGMTIDDVIARRRQLGGARHEIQVDPGVDAQTCLMGVGDDGGERIERRRLPHQLRGARFQLALRSTRRRALAPGPAAC